MSESPLTDRRWCSWGVMVQKQNDHSHLIKPTGRRPLNIVVSVTVCHFHLAGSPTQTKQAATRLACRPRLSRGTILQTVYNSIEHLIKDQSGIPFFKMNRCPLKLVKNAIKDIGVELPQKIMTYLALGFLYFCHNCFIRVVILVFKTCVYFSIMWFLFHLSLTSSFSDFI